MVARSPSPRLAAVFSDGGIGEWFWTADFSEQVRRSILRAAQNSSNDDRGYAERARDLILREKGLPTLAGKRSKALDFESYFMSCEHGEIPGLVEAICEVIDEYQPFDPSDPVFTAADRELLTFEGQVNFELRLEGVVWELAGGRMVPLSSQAMHERVVEPMLRLVSKEGWERVERAYQYAMANANTFDLWGAIEDAATALKEALILCGAEGESLEEVIASAEVKGTIAGHDRPLLDVVAIAANWVAIDAKALGDEDAEPTRDDAWFMVHIVGAIILRLAAGAKRS